MAEFNSKPTQNQHENCELMGELTEAIQEVAKAIQNVMEKIWEIIKKAFDDFWSALIQFLKQTDPKIYHFAYYHPNKRVRKKNIKRLFKMLKRC